jgi:hypothetical protein
MSYTLALWILFILLLITYSIVRKRKNRTLNVVLFFLLIGILLTEMVLPGRIWGKWNAISSLGNKEVREIVLRPSAPGWKVNLVGKNYIITDKKQIDSLLHLFKKVEVYFPNHPTRIWETQLVFKTAAGDSLKIEVKNTDNNGTVIYTPTNKWRIDDAGPYLERITQYTGKPSL